MWEEVVGVTDDEKRELLGMARRHEALYGDGFGENGVVRRLADALEGTLAEPEWEWEFGYELLEPDTRDVFDRDGHYVSPAFAFRAAKKRIEEECSADLPRLQYLIVRRRKPGPWEVVTDDRD